jgi:hypothetical protein
MPLKAHQHSFRDKSAAPYREPFRTFLPRGLFPVFATVVLNICQASNAELDRTFSPASSRTWALKALLKEDLAEWEIEKSFDH